MIPKDLAYAPPRRLDNHDMETACASTPDIQTVGDPGHWVTICKASSEEQGWIKSTKALECGVGCLVQVTTEHRYAGKVIACAEALTFVPGVTLAQLRGDE